MLAGSFTIRRLKPIRPAVPHDVLYIPAGGWNDPQWLSPSTLLTILFGKQQLEFVLTPLGRQRA
jgi:hypothetical protein